MAAMHQLKTALDGFIHSTGKSFCLYVYIKPTEKTRICLIFIMMEATKASLA
jgi:hypothetical protein